MIAASMAVLGSVASGQDASPAPSTVPAASVDPCASPAPKPSPVPSGPPVAAASPGGESSPAPSAPPVASVAPGASADPSTVPASPSPSPSPSADPCGPSIIDLGKDGRLTVLVLGSDWRKELGGERLDVIIVMSLDPRTGRVIAASLPRDLVFFPQAKRNGGGTSGLTRVNSLYYYYRDKSLAHDKVDRKAVKRFLEDVETALKVEIDYWALARFKGFGTMIESLGGIRVDVPRTITDTSYGRTGAYFPEGDDYRLKGLQRCSMKKPCRNVLIYARSRKGTVGEGFNSDFERARRQQEVVVAAVRKVVREGFSPRQVEILLNHSKERVWTDLPRTIPAALELLELAKDANLRPFDTAVFGPRKWAYEDSQTPTYTYRLNLPLVRAWIDDRLGTKPKPD